VKKVFTKRFYRRLNLTARFQHGFRGGEYYSKPLNALQSEQSFPSTACKQPARGLLSSKFELMNRNNATH
jgi:hypothetical protein